MSIPLPEESNFIAIGAWNPAIIQPHWLKRHFPDKIPDTAKIEITSVGAGFSFKMDYEKVTIDPSNGRLIFIPKVLNKETMQYIAELCVGIRKKLEYTPIVAAGCNFVFKLEKDESFKIDKIEQEEKIADLYIDLQKKGNLISKSIRHTFGLEDCSVNITYDYSENDKIVRINFDFKGTDPMKRAAEALMDNFEYTNQLIKDIIRKN